MELDTGSSVSIKPETFYRQNLRGEPLQKTKIKLQTLTGENINPLGRSYVPAKNEGTNRSSDSPFALGTSQHVPYTHPKFRETCQMIRSYRLI